MDTVILNNKNYIINYLALTSKMHIMRFLIYQLQLNVSGKW